MRADAVGLGIEQNCVPLSKRPPQTGVAHRYRMKLLDLGANEEDVTKVGGAPEHLFGHVLHTRGDAERDADEHVLLIRSSMSPAARDGATYTVESDSQAAASSSLLQKSLRFCTGCNPETPCFGFQQRGDIAVDHYSTDRNGVVTHATHPSKAPADPK